MTPGRVAEALAAAGTALLDNVVLHVDWNQASIDSDHVCRDGDEPGDYVQWDPGELSYLHDWNVIDVPDGLDFQQIVAAQRAALEFDTGQPTAIVYSHREGLAVRDRGPRLPRRRPPLCSPEFYDGAGAVRDRDRRAPADLRRPRLAALQRDRRRGRAGTVLCGARCRWSAAVIDRSDGPGRRSLAGAAPRLDGTPRRGLGPGAPRVRTPRRSFAAAVEADVEAPASSRSTRAPRPRCAPSSGGS